MSRCYQLCCPSENSESGWIDAAVHAYVHQEGIFDPDQSYVTSTIDSFVNDANHEVSGVFDSIAVSLSHLNVVGQVFQDLADVIDNV